MKRLFLILLAACSTDPAEQIDPVIRLAPSADMAADVQASIDLWVAETGLPIVIDSTGIPMSYGSPLEDLGVRVCAKTTVSPARGVLSVEIDNTAHCGDNITHEIGHVICRHFNVDGGDCHSDNPEGVMFWRAGWDLDKASIDVVCADAPCIRPEK
jgi:hypothetical protein